MHLACLLLLVGLFDFALALTPTKTQVQRQDIVRSEPDGFVTTNSMTNQFSVNGSDFRFVGTNAYWLAALNTEDDIVTTFANMSAQGIRVVRVWAFNDVETIPVNGTWFQLISNGTTIVNNGTNGLQKLDLVVKHAENFGIYLLLVLTNNWNPRPLFDDITSAISNLTATVESPGIVRRDVTPGTNNTLPRNTLSNDFGGMDVYVRQFGLTAHDDFFTNETLISTFENYTTSVVSRYVESPAILAWEVANDPRCNSSISSSANCNTATITKWLNRTSNHIRSIDTNHLVTSGVHGFTCDGCAKLFPPPKQPAPSPAPGQRRNLPPDLTKGILSRKRAEVRKRRLALTKKDTKNGIRIRGKWFSGPTRRQTTQPTTDSDLTSGVQGVDSADVINMPQIGFGTFQLFPDQNTYGINDPSLSPLNNTIEAGISWIEMQAQIGMTFGKPVTLTGFGLVTQGNAPSFVPFNTSIAPFGPGQVDNSTGTVQPFGVTDQGRDEAYEMWLDAAIKGGLQGMIQYQWGQDNLTAMDGTEVAPDVTSPGVAPDETSVGVSPNDGYSIQGVGEPAVQGIIQQAAQQITSSDSAGG